MGITTNDFFENIYSVIFSPKAFFERQDLQISIRLAIATILFVSSVTIILGAVLSGDILSILFPFSFVFKLITALICWFLTALFFEYIAKIFDRGNKLNKILFLTAFAPVPYIFYAPLSLLKNTGDIGYVIGTIFEFFLYFWIIYLYALSLKSVYNLTNARAFMFILIPFISSFFAIYWGICFFQRMLYIFSV